VRILDQNAVGTDPECAFGNGVGAELFKRPAQLGLRTSVPPGTALLVEQSVETSVRENQESTDELTNPGLEAQLRPTYGCGRVTRNHRHRSGQLGRTRECGQSPQGAQPWRSILGTRRKLRSTRQKTFSPGAQPVKRNFSRPREPCLGADTR